MGGRSTKLAVASFDSRLKSPAAKRLARNMITTCPRCGMCNWDKVRLLPMAPAVQCAKCGYIIPIDDKAPSGF